tara:strand:- start:168 stop:431 length:264 start_codon:yes stop_codon:yes gene_type:complete
MFVIEVVKKTSKNKLDKKILGKHEHIGYMKVKFKTKEEAYKYYDIHNKHMRPINLYNTGISDIDPITKLAYIVRLDYDITETIDPFY